MSLRDAIKEYQGIAISERANIENIYLVLRRSGIDSFEELRASYFTNPKKLETLRGIGPYRMKLISDMIDYFD